MINRYRRWRKVELKCSSSFVTMLLLCASRHGAATTMILINNTMILLLTDDNSIDGEEPIHHRKRSVSPRNQMRQNHRYTIKGRPPKFWPNPNTDNNTVVVYTSMILQNTSNNSSHLGIPRITDRCFLLLFFL